MCFSVSYIFCTILNITRFEYHILLYHIFEYHCNFYHIFEYHTSISHSFSIIILSAQFSLEKEKHKVVYTLFLFLCSSFSNMQFCTIACDLRLICISILSYILHFSYNIWSFAYTAEAPLGSSSAPLGSLAPPSARVPACQAKLFFEYALPAREARLRTL